MILVRTTYLGDGRIRPSSADGPPALGGSTVGQPRDTDIAALNGADADHEFDLRYLGDGPTPLSGDDLKRWQLERDRLIRMLAFVGDKGKTKCREYLESIGLDVHKIFDTLANEVPYDAFNSLNDANEDFGMAGISVKQFIDNWAAQGVPFDGGAATGSTGRNYYTPGGISLSIILHETIHSSFNGAGERTLYDPDNPKSNPMTGIISFGPGSALISDAELQAKMGIAVQTDSTNITRNLENHGCK